MAKIKQERADNFIKFLGTAGARFVMIRQLRASGGIWVSSKGTNVIIDPGPGCIVRCAASRPKLDPTKLDGIIVTHRHLDHCGDLNVMIEAMTEGGFKKGGVVFCPADAVEDDSIISAHLKSFPERIEILKPNTEYTVGNFQFQTSMPHLHPVFTYGLKFRIAKQEIAILTDTRYFRELADFYKADVLIAGVVFVEPRPGVEHLCLDDIRMLLGQVRPQKTILTHFGMTMLKAKPHIQAEKLSTELNLEVLAAYDGMTLNF